jgi:hypothetical protein
MQASLQRHGAVAGFLSEGQATIDALLSIVAIREMVSKRRCQEQATRASAMPQAVLPVRAVQHLGERSREPPQGCNADGRIPEITFLPEVRLSSRISLATIRAQKTLNPALGFRV